ncbi:hypothetical protein RRG08_016811 [Elysia crispata]|uniref:Uncharacterized protein n=1 Tax=Elysia crispata TaxID=231223 RepID=A0AAE1A175_9GAST|nr:hypothetical protein RRG08_016811 [Elysia crispata]
MIQGLIQQSPLLPGAEFPPGNEFPPRSGDFSPVEPSSGGHLQADAVAGREGEHNFSSSSNISCGNPAKSREKFVDDETHETKEQSRRLPGFSRCVPCTARQIVQYVERQAEDYTRGSRVGPHPPVFQQMCPTAMISAHASYLVGKFCPRTG